MKQMGAGILIQSIFKVEDNFTPDKIDASLNLYSNRLKESL